MKNEVRNKEEQKKAPKRKRKPRKNGFSKIANGLLNGEFLTKEGFIKHLPYIGYLAFLFLVFIGIGYFYEDTLRNLSKSERKLENIKHEYHTTMYKLEILRLQSRMMEDMKDMGLTKTVEQPKIIEVEEGYFEQEQ